MLFLLLTLFSLILFTIDQYTKCLTVSRIILHGEVPFWEGVLQFTHERNSGAAFSLLEGQRGLFILIFLALTALILFEYFKKPLPFKRYERWFIAAIYGGALGNMFDRVRLGYVIDMIETQFIKFPVFNVADCFICCGCIALLISLIFFNKEFWKGKKK